MAEPPLIVHVIHHLVIGGMENGLVNLINRIPATRYRHCVMCIEDFSDFRNRIERPDVRVLAMRRSTLTSLQLYQRIHSTLRELRPAIVHSRNLSGLDALLPAYLARVPVRIHGEHGFDVNDLSATNLKLRVLRRMHSPLVQRYVTVSKDLANYLVRQVGIAASRIAQIYNGVDTAKFAPAPQKPAGVMPEDFYGGDRVVVGTVGRLQPIKNQIALVRAFAQLLRDVPRLRANTRLALVGDGPLRAELSNSVQAEGLTDVVWLAGASDEVARLYQCLDLFVLPSLREGISNTVLEAMASGLPVVATAVGGNVELVVDGSTGCLVPASDQTALVAALNRYATDDKLRTKQGAAARQRTLEHFSLESMVKGYLGLYDSLSKT